MTRITVGHGWSIGVQNGSAVLEGRCQSVLIGRVHFRLPGRSNPLPTSVIVQLDSRPGGCCCRLLPSSWNSQDGGTTTHLHNPLTFSKKWREKCSLLNKKKKNKLKLVVFAEAVKRRERGKNYIGCIELCSHVSRHHHLSTGARLVVN